MVYPLQTLIPVVALFSILWGKVGLSLAEKVGYNDACKDPARRVMIQEPTIVEAQGIDVRNANARGGGDRPFTGDGNGFYSVDFRPYQRRADKAKSAQKTDKKNAEYFHYSLLNRNVGHSAGTGRDLGETKGNVARPNRYLRGRKKAEGFLWGFSSSMKNEKNIAHEAINGFSRVRRSMGLINTLQEKVSTSSEMSPTTPITTTNEAPMESTGPSDQSTLIDFSLTEETTSMPLATSTTTAIINTEELPSGTETPEMITVASGTITSSTDSATVGTLQPEPEEKQTSEANLIPGTIATGYSPSTPTDESKETTQAVLFTSTPELIPTSDPPFPFETSPVPVSPDTSDISLSPADKITSTSMEPIVTDEMITSDAPSTGDSINTMPSPDIPDAVEPESSSITFDAPQPTTTMDAPLESVSPDAQLSTANGNDPLEEERTVSTVSDDNIIISTTLGGTTVDISTIPISIASDMSESTTPDIELEMTEVTMTNPAESELPLTFTQSSPATAEADMNQDITDSLIISTISSSTVAESTTSEIMTGANLRDSSDPTGSVSEMYFQSTVEGISTIDLSTSPTSLPSTSIQSEMETLQTAVSSSSTEATISNVVTTDVEIENSSPISFTATSATTVVTSDPDPTEKSSSPSNQICDDSLWLVCDMNTERCKCKPGMTYDSERNICVSLEGKDCQSGGGSDGKICVKNAECSQKEIGEQGTCKCQEGFLPTGDGHCLPGLDLPCELTPDGTDPCFPSLKCSSGKCICQENYVKGRPEDHRCYLDAHANCSVENDECNDFAFLKCSESTKMCTCQGVQEHTYDPDEKACVAVSGFKCMLKSDAEGRLLKCVKNSSCKQADSSDEGKATCECETGFENDWRGNCFPKNSGTSVSQSSRGLIHLLGAIVSVFNFKCFHPLL